jgi:hypothetical protein
MNEIAIGEESVPDYTKRLLKWLPVVVDNCGEK